MERAGPLSGADPGYSPWSDGRVVAGVADTTGSPGLAARGGSTCSPQLQISERVGHRMSSVRPHAVQRMLPIAALSMD
jgi:hypothetical protein